jgi:hypothetical protein
MRNQALHEMTAKVAVEFAGVFGRIKAKNDGIWAVLKEVLMSHAEKLSPHDVAKSLAALTKVNQVTPDITQAFHGKVVEILKKFNPNLNSLKAISRAYSIAHLGDDEFWNLLEWSLTKKDFTTDAKTLVGFAYDFSRVRKGSPRFWEALENALESACHKVPNDRLVYVLADITRNKRLLITDLATRLKERFIKQLLEAKEVDFTRRVELLSFNPSIILQLKEEEREKLNAKCLEWLDKSNDPQNRNVIRISLGRLKSKVQEHASGEINTSARGSWSNAK